MEMAKLEYYSVVVSNKPGKAAHVLSELKEAGVTTSTIDLEAYYR